MFHILCKAGYSHTIDTEEQTNMKLKDLERFHQIVIQCHDNPDADAIASGFALYRYFQSIGRTVDLIYGGRFQIQKSNLVLMVKSMKIPIRHCEELSRPELLLTVDCQYGEGNVTRFEAGHIAVLDHHQPVGKEGPLTEIRSRLGSCSTLVWLMLLDAGFDANTDRNLATALYYGLFTDTNSLTEIHHPSDRDLQDGMDYDKSLIALLKNSNLSEGEVKIAGLALLETEYLEEQKSALVRAEPCDPNILGLISDLMLQVDTVHTCVVYSELGNGIKLSIRSCTKVVRANEFAAFLTAEIGSGGGHTEKAGGFIQQALLRKKFPGIWGKEYILRMMKHYFDDSRVLYAKNAVLDRTDMKKYKKKPISVGYAEAARILPVGTPITIRTLECDLDIKIETDIYIMIGILGEVYPIKADKFERSYRRTTGSFEADTEYPPQIKNLLTGHTLALLPFAKACVPTGSVEIYAKPVEHITKVFTAWDEDEYMLGRPGDILAVRSDDEHDIYIIDRKIFGITYEEI